MKKAKERFFEYNQQQIQLTANKLLALTLDQMNYPNFDPARAEQITAELLAQGRLAIVPEGKPLSQDKCLIGVCV